MVYESIDHRNDVTCHAVPVVLFLVFRKQINVIVKNKSTTIFHDLHSYRPEKWRHSMFKTLQWNHSMTTLMPTLKLKRCTCDSVNVKHGHCFFSGYEPALYAEFGKFDDFVWKKATVYSDSFNGHLYKKDISVKRTHRVGRCLSLLLLFDSL